jgi:hypothetical protein
MKRLPGLLLLLTALPFSARGDEPADAVALVAELYRAYAWEAVVAEPHLGPGLFGEPREVLERYLAPELVEGVLADRQRSEESGEIGALDHAPMWASQDPGASMLRVEAGAQPTEVRVEFIYPGNSQRIGIDYRLVQTAKGWRVVDIRSDDGLWLLGRLGQE